MRTSHRGSELASFATITSSILCEWATKERHPWGTADPDILRYLEGAQRLFITNNRVSMPSHVADHVAAGRHHWGIFRTREVPIGQLVAAVILFWEASDAEEWIDVDDWIPF